jgi:hypothetical protein
LNCHNNIDKYEKLNDLELEGCINLEKLDAAENELTSLNLSCHPNLKVVSLKENALQSLEINIPKLEFLDASRQRLKSSLPLQISIGSIEVKKIPVFTKLIIGKNNNNLRRLFYTKGATFERKLIKAKEDGHDSDYESEEIKTDPKSIRKIFPKLQKFECSTGETYDFEEYLDKLRKKKRAKKLKKAKKEKNKQTDSENQNQNESQIITDPSQLTNDYPDLLDEFGNEPEITIAGEDLMGIMIIDGYQGRKINVGDNYLSYLAVRNCPNLTTLRYAHNALKHDA